MAATEGQYYINSSGVTIGQSEVSNLRIEGKGQTRDGFNIHHFTFFRLNNTRMSYDTVKINGEYHYIIGSGHEVDARGNITRWDWGNQVTWEDAQHMYSHQVIRR